MSEDIAIDSHGPHRGDTVDPNEIGTIYFGTRIENMVMLDRDGISRPISVFDDLPRSSRNRTNVTAVIPKRFARSLRRPPVDKKIDGIPQEYYSLALHPFIAAIEPDMIAGWIVGPETVAVIQKEMDSGTLSPRSIWDVTSLRPMQPSEA